MAKTVDDILKQVHRIYEGDIDYLEFEDDETQLHFSYLLDALDEWLDRFPDDTVTTPADETDEVEVARPFFVTAYILNKLYSEDDTEKATEYALKMNEEERLERVARAKSDDADTPNRLTVQGAGMTDLTLSEEDITI